MPIAGLALLVSFLSSGFAVYQWWTSGRDEKIRATIEISNKYNDEAIDPKALAVAYEVASGELEAGTINALEMNKLDLDEVPLKIRKYFERLEYISYLANRKN